MERTTHPPQGQRPPRFRRGHLQIYSPLPIPRPSKKPWAVEVDISRTMSAVEGIANVVVRQAAGTAAASLAAAATAKPACASDNGYDGRIGLRVSSIFVILVGSTFGESNKPSLVDWSHSWNDTRCLFSCLRWPSQRSGHARMGLLHSEVLRFRRHHSNSLHPRTYLESIPSSTRLTLHSFLPQPVML